MWTIAWMPQSRWVVLSVAMLAPLWARPAAGQGHGISIGWEDCRAGGGPGFDRPPPFGCASNNSSFPLYAGVQLASPIDSVFSAELVIDVDVAASPLPDWWSMDGTCPRAGWRGRQVSPREAAPTPGTAPVWARCRAGCPACPGDSARHARLLVAATVLSSSAVTLDADVAYTVCRVTLDSRNTTACPNGCTTPACMVFNSLLIRRLPGSSVEEILVTDPEVAGANMVVWHPLLGSADCASVPVRRSTWGAVKSLYR